MSESFAVSAFARFINSPAGRVARVVAGLLLMAWGYVRRSEAAGVILMVVGLVPLAAGALDLCIISALLGGPIRDARMAKRTPQGGKGR